MQDHFSIKVNDQFEFELSRKEAEELDMLNLTENQLHLLQNQKSLTSKIIKSDVVNKTYHIQINSNPYEVNISDEVDVLIKKMGFERNESKETNAIHAPMPGLILDLMVKEGDEVKENQALLILEAMKMENEISSPRDAVIKKIHVKKGQAIENKFLIIEFE